MNEGFFLLRFLQLIILISSSQVQYNVIFCISADRQLHYGHFLLKKNSQSKCSDNYYFSFLGKTVYSSEMIPHIETTYYLGVFQKVHPTTLSSQTFSVRYGERNFWSSVVGLTPDLWSSRRGIKHGYMFLENGPKEPYLR